MKKVFQEVCKFKKELIVIIVTVIGSTMCTLGLPSLISNIINTDIPNEDFGGILRTGGFMLILVVVGIFMRYRHQPCFRYCIYGCGQKLAQPNF